MLSHSCMYLYISCISSFIEQPLFFQQFRQSRQAEILHLYASTILYSSIFFSVNFLISLLVSPFILGEPFNIKVFIIISFRILQIISYKSIISYLGMFIIKKLLYLIKTEGLSLPSVFAHNRSSTLSPFFWSWCQDILRCCQTVQRQKMYRNS